MNSSNISVADIRNICKVLVDTEGDVVKTARNTGFPLEMIKRIKNKQYMKNISDSYFDNNQWDTENASGVKVPERISIDVSDINIDTPKVTFTSEEGTIPMSINDDTEKDAKVDDTKAESKPSKRSYHYAKIDKNKVRRICQLIVEQRTNGEISKIVTCSPTTVTSVRLKKKFPELSDEYFDLIKEKPVTIRLKDGTILESGLHGVIVRDDIIIPNNTLSESENKTSANTKTSTTLDDIDKLIINKLSDKKINELPDDIKNKVIECISEVIGDLTIKQIKELL